MTERAVPLEVLAASVPGAELAGGGACAVSGIGYDSRQVQPGDLFAALRGADFDGHEFAADAERRGAVALLVERNIPARLPRIVVRDSRAALADVAATFFGHPSRSLGVIGITGTDGKTTTSYLVDHLLSAAGRQTGMVGTVAVRIGGAEDVHASRQTTPESSEVQRYLRQMADAGTDWAVLEATSHGLAMHRLDQVRFRIGAVTNVTHEHLDYHGSIEAYRRAKAILLERVGSESGVAVLNADDPGAEAIAPYSAGAQIVRYGVTSERADVRALEVQSGATGSRFVLEAAGHGRSVVDLPLIGTFNVANALCAAAVALATEVRLETIATALGTTPAVPGRMTQVDAGQPFSVVVDYAHTPDSLAKVLTLLRSLHSVGRLIAVFGSAGERDIQKRPLQGAVAARQADISVVTSEDPRFEDAEAIIEQIAAGAVGAGAERGRTLYTVTERRDALRLAFSLAQPGDCVLLAGKGHEGSIIWGREKRPWDEVGVARELLADMGEPAAHP